MFASIAWILLISPFDLVEASIPRTVFPANAKDWDRIGLFALKDGEKVRLVLLYKYDTDSVAEKMMKKQGWAMSSYPNCFDVHAVYRDGAGRWVHKEVFGFARVRFTKVEKVAPDHLLLECRGNFRAFIQLGADNENELKRVVEANKPFTKRVSFVDGTLKAE